MTHRIIIEEYHKLLELYGPQGWWPLGGEYHPGRYDLPQSANQRFEICVGAILTQNTAWKSVEKALTNLRKAELIQPLSLQRIADDNLKEAIRPAGYFNRKCVYLKTFAEFFVGQNDSPPNRAELLKLRGIGPETADSMLLYGWQQPWFVVDTYTRRLFSSAGIITMQDSYQQIQHRFHSALEPLFQSKCRIRVYQEYHALIVQHAKLHRPGVAGSLTQPH